MDSMHAVDGLLLHMKLLMALSLSMIAMKLSFESILKLNSVNNCNKMAANVSSNSATTIQLNSYIPNFCNFDRLLEPLYFQCCDRQHFAMSVDKRIVLHLWLA